MHTIKKELLDAIEDTLSNDVCFQELQKEDSDSSIIMKQIMGVIEDVARQNSKLALILDNVAEPTFTKQQY